MILCVFEGPRENNWFRPISRLFLKDEVIEYFIVEGTFQRLYNNLKNNDWDTLEALRDIESNRKEADKRLLGYHESDFSEVYLFFDYDPHAQQSIESLNTTLAEMLSFFDNETGRGKMYINYPMIEALRYTKQLPDNEFYKYVIPLDQCVNFKKLASNFSAYNNISFFAGGQSVSEDELMNNWHCLITQNVRKANYICTQENVIPKEKSLIGQTIILEKQVECYVNSENPCVSVLSSYPIFLFDYLRTL